MRLVVVGGGEIDLVGGDDRQRARVGEIEQLRLGLDLVLEAVALDLDVEPVAEDLLQPLQALDGAASCWPSRSARSIGPSGPPVSAIRPSAWASSRSISMCGGSVLGRIEEARG